MMQTTHTTPASVVPDVHTSGAQLQSNGIRIPVLRQTGKKRHNTRDVLGVEISLMSEFEFLGHISELLRRDQPVSPYLVATVNPEFVMTSKKDPDFHRVLQEASMNTADGTGICLGLKWVHHLSQERITGSDSMLLICERCAALGRSIFLLGAAPGVAEAAANQLLEHHPSLRINGVYSPPDRESGLDSYPARIQDAIRGSDVLFVALGAPAQEKWIHRHLNDLGRIRLAIGVGGTFDFLAGTVERAPKWMRDSGLEWLHRLLNQPSRWRRMLNLPTFLAALLVKAIATGINNRIHHPSLLRDCR